MLEKTDIPRFFITLYERLVMMLIFSRRSSKEHSLELLVMFVFILIIAACGAFLPTYFARMAYQLPG
jgi:hypothetical protein